MRRVVYLLMCGAAVAGRAARGELAPAATQPVATAEAPASAPASSAPKADSSIAGLIEQLGSSDPSAREAASKALIAIGPAARQALQEAFKSEDPQIRLQAYSVFRQLPWFDANDPAPVRQLLEGYARAGSADRCKVVEELAKLADGAGQPAIFRLLVDDQDSRVRWTAVAALHDAKPSPDEKRLRALESAVDNPPALALAGSAWEGKDFEKAVRLYQRALLTDPASSLSDGGHSAPIYQKVVSYLGWKRRYTEMAELMRLQAMRDPPPDPSDPTASNKLDDLFALHGDAGPLPGFEKDLEDLPEQLERPQFLYAMGRMQQRLGRPWLAGPLYESAFAASMDGKAQRLQLGQFLASHAWYDLAERELRRVIQLANGQPDVYAANAHLHLGLVAAARGNDEMAADELSAGLSEAKLVGGFLTRTTNRGEMSGEDAEKAMWVQVHWHGLRAARAKNDTPEMVRHAKQMAQFGADDADLALDAIPVLREHGDAQAADKLFTTAYALSKAALDETPSDPVRMNALAWLCARSGEHLPEARDLADKAVAVQPDNGAFLDTKAEVYFRLGRADEAVQLETRAIELMPDNPFMKEQLERFKNVDREGAKTRSSSGQAER